MISVTVTGADESVDPGALLDAFSRMQVGPTRVELGILFASPDRWHTPRFPGPGWWSELRKLRTQRFTSVPLAAHLCGSTSRAFCSGDSTALASAIFERVQVNGYEPERDRAGVRDTIRRVSGIAGANPEVILQCRSEETLQDVCRDAGGLPRGAVLFDVSGGRGVAPFRWPRTPVGARMGFAGGIGPDTIEDSIRAILSDGDFMRGDFWIDFESGARDPFGAFSIDAAAEVIRYVSKVNEREAHG